MSYRMRCRYEDAENDTMSAFARSKRATAQDLLQKLLFEFDELHHEYKESDLSNQTDVSLLSKELADLHERLKLAYVILKGITTQPRCVKLLKRVQYHFKKLHFKKPRFKPSKAIRLIRSAEKAFAKMKQLIDDLNCRISLPFSKLPYDVQCRFADLAPPQEAIRFQHMCEFTQKLMSLRRALFVHTLCINCKCHKQLIEKYPKTPIIRRRTILHLSVPEAMALSANYYVTGLLALYFDEKFKEASFVKGYSHLLFLGTYSCQQVYPFLHSGVESIDFQGNMIADASDYDTFVETLYEKTHQNLVKLDVYLTLNVEFFDMLERKFQDYIVMRHSDSELTIVKRRKR